MSVDNKILERIAKLLKLATSDNENEARLAAEKANELLLRHNLDAQQVRQATGGDQPLDGYTHHTAFDGPRRLPQMRYILPLLVNHFFVQIVRMRNVKNGPVKFIFIGTHTNVAVAVEIHDFLVLKFPELWLAYQRQTGASLKSRQSYWIGLANGLGQQFRSRRASVETERGLVLVTDPNVQRYLEHLMGPTKAGGFRKRDVGDADAYRSGKEDGERLRLQKNLDTGRTDGTAPRLAIGGKS